MFSKRNNGRDMGMKVSKNGVPSIISSDLSILGNLISEGSVEVEGRIEGNVTCSTATIHQSGFVKGDIIADIINISGELRGLVKARHVKLTEYARVTGVIMYETISIEPGAFVDGQCKNTDKLQRKDLDVLEAVAEEEQEIHLID